MRSRRRGIPFSSGPADGTVSLQPFTEEILFPDVAVPDELVQAGHCPLSREKGRYPTGVQHLTEPVVGGVGSRNDIHRNNVRRILSGPMVPKVKPMVSRVRKYSSSHLKKTDF